MDWCACSMNSFTSGKRRLFLMWICLMRWRPLIGKSFALDSPDPKPLNRPTGTLCKPSELTLSSVYLVRPRKILHPSQKNTHTQNKKKTNKKKQANKKPRKAFFWTCFELGGFSWGFFQMDLLPFEVFPILRKSRWYTLSHLIQPTMPQILRLQREKVAKRILVAAFHFREKSQILPSTQFLNPPAKNSFLSVVLSPQFTPKSFSAVFVINCFPANPEWGDHTAQLFPAVFWLVVAGDTWNISPHGSRKAAQFPELRNIQHE